MSTLSWSTALIVSTASVNLENVEVVRMETAGSWPFCASGSGGATAGADSGVDGLGAAACLRPVSLSTSDISAPLAREYGSQLHAGSVGGRLACLFGTARDL